MFRPPCEHCRGALRSRRVPLPASKPRWGRGRIWTRLRPRCQLWAPAVLAAAAVSSDAHGPQGCGGCRAVQTCPQRPGLPRGQDPQGWACDQVAGGGWQPPALRLAPLRAPGDVGDVVWQPTLASRRSYGQELSCLDNLETSGLRLTCSHKHSC